MQQWVGLLDTLSTAQLDATGNSGWLAWPSLPREAGFEGGIIYDWLPTLGHIAAVPAGMASTDTVDLDLEIAFSAAGLGAIKVHDFTQIVNTNVQENLVIPAGLSVSAFSAPLSHLTLGSHYRWAWVSTNNPAGTIALYAALS